mmetsp:Transcript_63504/g.184109  ORF Transcript_63504/g.184109 Transcript_63504/m.184109 type:complete len:202 (+) Transcript_63504:317-922(+)
MEAKDASKERSFSSSACCSRRSLASTPTTNSCNLRSRSHKAEAFSCMAFCMLSPKALPFSSSLALAVLAASSTFSALARTSLSSRVRSANAASSSRTRSSERRKRLRNSAGTTSTVGGSKGGFGAAAEPGRSALAAASCARASLSEALTPASSRRNSAATQVRLATWRSKSACLFAAPSRGALASIASNNRTMRASRSCNW